MPRILTHSEECILRKEIKEKEDIIRSLNNEVRNLRMALRDKYGYIHFGKCIPFVRSGQWE